VNELTSSEKIIKNAKIIMKCSGVDCEDLSEERALKVLSVATGVVRHFNPISILTSDGSVVGTIKRDSFLQAQLAILIR